MKFDDILIKLGKYGRYQMRIYFLLCFPSILCSLHMLASVFLAAVPPNYRCVVPGYDGDSFEIQNDTHRAYVNAFIPLKEDGTYDRCNVYANVNHTWATDIYERNVTVNLTETTTCNAWVYDRSIFTETAITQFDLVCSNEPQTTIATVLFMAGVLVGAFIFGILSDVIGRKKTLLLASVLQAAAGVGCGFSPNYYAFVSLRFLVGTASSGIFMTAFVIGMELMVPSMRLFAGIVIEIFFAMGYLILTGLAYLIRDWSWLQIACSAPSVLLLSFAWLLPESSRWLMARGRFDETEEIIRHAAKVNGVDLPEKLFDEGEETQESLQISQLPGQMIKAPTLLLRTVIIFFNWAVVAMVYYGLSLNSGNLGGDIFFNFMLSGLVEFPANIFCFSCKWLGRKGPFAGSMVLGGLACISTIFVVMFFDSNNDWLIALSMIGKFGATVGFTTIYFWSAEIYPTVCRNGLMGMSSMFARVGSMVSAPIADLGKLAGGTMGAALPQIVFGSLTILAGLLSLALPETTGKMLPETIAEGNTFGKSDKESIDKKDVNLVPSYKMKDADEHAYSNPALDKATEAEHRL